MRADLAEAERTYCWFYLELRIAYRMCFVGRTRFAGKKLMPDE
jgi:hypothetical protein